MYIWMYPLPLLRYVVQGILCDMLGTHIIYICMCQCIYVCAWRVMVDRGMACMLDVM